MHVVTCEKGQARSDMQDAEVANMQLCHTGSSKQAAPGVDVGLGKDVRAERGSECQHGERGLREGRNSRQACQACMQGKLVVHL